MFSIFFTTFLTSNVLTAFHWTKYLKKCDWLISNPCYGHFHVISLDETWRGTTNKHSVFSSFFSFLDHVKDLVRASRFSRASRAKLSEQIQWVKTSIRLGGTGSDRWGHKQSHDRCHHPSRGCRPLCMSRSRLHLLFHLYILAAFSALWTGIT